jgi:hypothetical protein
MLNNCRVCSLLEPLAIAAHVTQGSRARLYHVLITLGNLFRIYSNRDLDTAGGPFDRNHHVVGLFTRQLRRKKGKGEDES